MTYLLSSGSPNRRVADELDNLIRVFCVFDDKSEPDHRHGAYVLVSDARQARQTEIRNGYSICAGSKTATGILTFRRPELVDRMNQILAQHYPNALASETR